MLAQKIIRFEISNPGGGDVNKLPKGVEGDTSLMMWKELCRTGVYETEGVEHNIEISFLKHIVDVFKKRQKKGIEVPCPIGHTHDPEKKRGRVLFLELRKQKNGETSLYGIIEFVSEEAKKLLEHSDVSIDAPEQVCDGDGESHKFALDHVAFTDYPVVAGMEKFTDVQFSIITTPQGGRNMARRKRFENDDDLKKDEQEFENEEQDKEEDETLARKKKLSRKKKFEKEEDEDDAEFDNGIDEDDEDEDEDDVECSDDDEDEDDVECSDDEDEEDGVSTSRKRLGKKGKKFSRNSAPFSLLRENRSLKIQGMLRDGKITPAQGRLMRSLYCSDSAIRFSLDSHSNRDFKNACRLLAAGVGADFSEQTGIQFSQNDPKDNVLSRIIGEKYSSGK